MGNVTKKMHDIPVWSQIKIQRVPGSHLFTFRYMMKIRYTSGFSAKSLGFGVFSKKLTEIMQNGWLKKSLKCVKLNLVAIFNECKQMRAWSCLNQM